MNQITKKRRKRTKNNYFTKVHENAIVEYTHCECPKRRTELYVDFIGPAFNEMVDKITYTYKFSNLPNIDPLKEECKIWLTTILDKYDQSKGSKAFSYFSVVTKHWFFHKVKKNATRQRREVSYEELNETSGSELKEVRIEGDQYLNQREEVEFWNSLFGQINRWDDANLKENEKKVLDAVRILMQNVDEIDMFNKKAIYLYLREITGLKTKQVVSNLKKIREKYRIFKIKWDRGEI